jgi:hypothetical protein
MTVVATPLAALGLATALATTAYAAPPPAPAHTIIPGVASAGAGNPLYLFYTGGDNTVWTGSGTATPAGPFTQISDGKLVSGPSAIAVGAVEYVFGRAANGQLYWATGNRGAWTNWTSLGGNITSSPSAVFQGPLASDFSVFARGTNGAAWELSHTSAGWGVWHSIGGNLWAGTGPAAAFLGGTWVLVTGVDKQMYVQQVGVTGFSKAGGQTTATPGLAAITGALVGFARGTNNIAYYHRFLSTSPGWQVMGGTFTLTSPPVAVGVGTTTYTYVLGPDNQIYRNIGSWATYPPAFTGWTKITG